MSFMCAINWFPQPVQRQTEGVLNGIALILVKGYLDQKASFKVAFFFPVVLDFCECCIFPSSSHEDCTVILFKWTNGKHWSKY